MTINVASKTTWWIIGAAVLYFLYVRGGVPAGRGQAIETDGPWGVVS
ncbi:MAG: hypothetical protein PHS60_02135 [Zavarzinia sp.]|nr:hypothetical protein [Zavarzinia sp.]